MSTVTNPVTFDITDTAAVTQGVTSFKVLVGTTTGGPYTASSASVNLSTLNDSAGVYSAPWSSLTFSPALQAFTTYFAVVEATNAQGVSGNSPEVSFQNQTAPTAPTAFALA